MPQRIDYTFRSEGDFIVHLKFRDGQWREHSRWLIPGTERAALSNHTPIPRACT